MSIQLINWKKIKGLSENIDMPRPKKKQKRKVRIGQWKASAALSQLQLQELIKSKKVIAFVLVEEPEVGFWLEVKIKGSSELKYLTTKRANEEPRFYKRVEVLKRHLREQFGVSGLWRLHIQLK